MIQHEYKIHVAIAKHIESAFPQVIFTHAGKAKDETHAHFLSEMGYKAGTPDLLLFWSQTELKDCVLTKVEKFAGIEVKANTKQSSPQKTFEYLFVRAGGLYAVCHSVKEAHDTLVAWGCEAKHKGIKEPNLQTDAEKKLAMFNLYKPI
jgi:hypothetical protein